MSTTLVTALYDIGRERLTGKSAHRKFDKYLAWFKYTLSINVPIYIIIPEYLQDYVQEHRPSQYETVVEVREFEELAAYKHYYQRMQDTIDAMRAAPHAPSHYKECPEFITAKYETIIFSKFDFLKEAADINPFDSKYFVWLDAGTFYDEPPFDVTLEWPDPYKIRLLDGKFLVSDYNFDVNDKSPLSNKREYLTRNQNEICAFMLGGSADAVTSVHRQFWATVDEALNMGVINNEQHLLQLMVLEQPDLYYIYYRTRKVHYDKPVPLRDRMIPYELARGTHMAVDYPVNPKLKLLTVATTEVGDEAFAKWRKTAKYYGYDWEVLMRREKWGGFASKIRGLHKAVSEMKTPYVVFTDCTDVFLTGSSYELMDRFIENGGKLTVGAEMQMHYIRGKNKYHDVKTFFESLRQTPQTFPNSGFLMGTTSDMLKLMEIHLGHDDDQAACFDTIYEGKMPLAIDYHTNLVGNIPNYHEKNPESIGYFEFDSQLKRYRSVLYKTYPCVFHFPGKNWEPMRDFYVKSQPILVAQETSEDETYTWIILIVVLIILLVLLVLAAGYTRRWYRW